MFGRCWFARFWLARCVAFRMLRVVVEGVFRFAAVVSLVMWCCFGDLDM